MVVSIGCQAKFARLYAQSANLMRWNAMLSAEPTVPFLPQLLKVLRADDDSNIAALGRSRNRHSGERFHAGAGR